MTDNEIVKALECCIASRRRSDCIELNCPACVKEGCAYFNRSEEDEEDRSGVVFAEIAKDMAGIINRQKAEIERLRAPRYVAIPKPSNKYKSEISPLVYTEEFTLKRIDEEGIRAEAAKEFAERLKATMEDFARMDFRGSTYFCVGLHHIDNLVKEFTEGSKR